MKKCLFYKRNCKTGTFLAFNGHVRDVFPLVQYICNLAYNYSFSEGKMRREYI